MISIINKHKRVIIIFILLLCIPFVIGAQNTHEIHGDVINVEYGGRSAERPEPDRGGDKGKDKNSNNSKSPKINSTPIPAEKKATATINGVIFTISHETETRLKEFFDVYKTNGNVGNFVATVASIFALFDLFNLETSFPSIGAAFKLPTFDSEEVLITLAAPSIWNRAWRAQAVSYCEAEFSLALSKRNVNDAKVWLRIRDILANPERYKNGGLKYNYKDKTLILRSYPAEAYRGVAGFDLELTDMDINSLGGLTNYLMCFPESRDFIIYADYIYNFGKPKKEFNKLTARDKMLLNYALVHLNQYSKTYLENVFLSYAVHPNQTYTLWSTLKIFLYQDKWNNGRIPDTEIDSLGFFNDEMPISSDLVYGKYPTRGIFSDSLPPHWNIPSIERQETYKFYYQGLTR